MKTDEHGLLGLDPSRPEDALPIPWPPPGGLDPSQDPFARPVPVRHEEVPVPLLALDLEEKAHREERAPSRWGFTKDRAVALSVALHALLAFLLITAPPPREAPNPDELPPDLLGLNKLWAAPPSQPPIPIQFFPAPGPKASAPGPNPRPSDLDRKAGGGDPKLPKAETPKATASPGIRDLDAGKRGEGRGQGEDARAAAEAARQAQAQAEASRGDGGSPEDHSDSGKGAPSKKGLAGLAASPLRQISAEEAARAASREGSAGGGDEGGGFESEGGFVDSGPLSFDTKGYEWGPYAAEMVRRIKRNWEIPKLAHYGLKGRLVVRFYILKDGRVEGVRLLVSSGIPPFDNASMQAIRNSSPFRPLPPDFPNPREGVTITFLYNIRPDELDSFDQQKTPPRPLLPK